MRSDVLREGGDGFSRAQLCDGHCVRGAPPHRRGARARPGAAGALGARRARPEGADRADHDARHGLRRAAADQAAAHRGRAARRVAGCAAPAADWERGHVGARRRAAAALGGRRP